MYLILHRVLCYVARVWAGDTTHIRSIRGRGWGQARARVCARHQTFIQVLVSEYICYTEQWPMQNGRR